MALGAPLRHKPDNADTPNVLLPLFRGRLLLIFV